MSTGVGWIMDPSTQPGAWAEGFRAGRQCFGVDLPRDAKYKSFEWVHDVVQMSSDHGLGASRRQSSYLLSRTEDARKMSNYTISDAINKALKGL